MAAIFSCVAACSIGIVPSFAQVILTPAITFNTSTGLFAYSYSVMNGTSVSLALISLGAQPTGTTTVQNLSAPFGFSGIYDSGNGLVSFFEDGNPATAPTFAPGSTIGSFAFNSPFAPGDTTFEALDVNGNTFTGVTQAPVPEPAPLALCGLVLPLLGFYFLRRKSQRLAHSNS